VAPSGATLGGVKGGPLAMEPRFDDGPERARSSSVAPATPAFVDDADAVVVIADGKNTGGADGALSESSKRNKKPNSSRRRLHMPSELAVPSSSQNKVLQADAGVHVKTPFACVNGTGRPPLRSKKKSVPRPANRPE